MFINFVLNTQNNIFKKIVYLKGNCYFCQHFIWRGARVVMEQIANLSTGNRRQGSNPCLSAE